MTTIDTAVIGPSVAECLALINGIDLGPIHWTLTQGQYGEPAVMTPDEADKAIAQYRMTLKLWVKYPDDVVAITRLIDEVWHTHLLDSTKYVSDMAPIFGGYVHHYPYFGVQGEIEEAALYAAFDRGLELFKQEFSVDPRVANAAWLGNRHARQREYFLVNDSPVGDNMASCGTVRCCNACGKCERTMHGDPHMAAVMFGPRPS